MAYHHDMCKRSLFAGFCTALVVIAAACGRETAPPVLTTIAEQSGFARTGRFEEVPTLCAGFEQAWPSNVRCVEFGRTPEGRPLLALVASGDGTLTASAARDAIRPVVLIQGGIHAGEIDGKDAGFLALREMLEGKAADGALERVTLVFVPVFNADGHERFGPWNRPNQVGPEEMGWRTTAQNLNLNRDYVKADAPEMQAMLRLLGEWNPLVYADLHVTDGAEFEHDVSLNVAPTLAGNEQLVKAGAELRDELMRQLSAQGSLPIDFYPEFVRNDDPASGFAVGIGQPRFAQQYWAERNRFGVLVETHSWKNYQTRVHVTRNAVVALVELAAARGAYWQSTVRVADERASQIGGSTVALSFTNNDHVRMIDFRGYAYTREPSAVSGTLRTRYDSTRPQTWRVPLFDEVRPALTVTAPRAGYIVPAAYAAWVTEKLTLHGIRSRILGEAASLGVETFRASRSTIAAETFEGRTVRTVEGEWAREERHVPGGSLFVPIGQPNSHLVIALFEPRAPDSFVSWGFFNQAFERKEYMEAYVTEEVAAGMLEKDATLKAEFDRRLRTDAAFAGSPAARLDFFYQRHPAWDERFNLYPVYRVDSEPR